MCTISVIPHPSGGRGYRLVTNRDELRTRPPATPPRWFELEGGRAIWPTDTQGGGTWVGAAESGLCLTLLNVNRGPVTPGTVSRGVIIPRLIESATPAEAIARLRQMDLSVHSPFRLVVAGPEPVVMEGLWDGSTLEVKDHGAPPVCFVSSGLGDEKVIGRLPLFGQTVVPDPTPEAQDEFHHHVWPDRRPVSVMMSRQDARTVSVTTVEFDGREVRMDYQPIAETDLATASAGSKV